MESDRRVELLFFLDKERENKLFFSYLYSEDFSFIEEFVILFLTKTDEGFKEVVKYDFSKREKPQVHYFYKKHPRKVYLDVPVTLETIFELKDGLVVNWHKHLLKFRDD